jgi:8-oxo-dGTP pyrophosphatase MutT (NUDIX family)
VERHLLSAAEAQVATVDAYVLRRVRGQWETLVLRRAGGTRCTGAWEAVHGHIEEGERPEDAAIREVAEEAGLTVQRLYNVAVQPFYLHTTGIVTLAVAFAAVVDAGVEAVLGPEHDVAEWLSLDAARARMAWPRSRTALADISILLASGDGGPVEDVLRVR